jgi:hypothetical protein
MQLDLARDEKKSLQLKIANQTPPIPVWFPKSMRRASNFFGYYEGRNLIYVARTRNGFTPALPAIDEEVAVAGDQRMRICENPVWLS